MPLPERLALIRKAGFSLTSLWWEDEIGIPGISRALMPDLVRDSGLILENVHVPYDNIDDLWSESNRRRDSIVNRHLAWIEEFRRYDIPIMVMHILDHSCPPQPNRFGIESISRIVKAAEAAGVVIAIENTGNAHFIDHVLSRIDTEYLGFCYDSSHDWLYSSDKTFVLKKCGHRLACTHLSDNDGKKDRHWLPQQGHIDWQLLCRLLPLDTYSGAISLEVTASPAQQQSMSPQQYLNEAYRRLLHLFDPQNLQREPVSGRSSP